MQSMNPEKKSNAREENILRKWGLDSVVRQFIRSISTTVSQALRDSLKSFLSKK
jgi:hypothetical protein